MQVHLMQYAIVRGQAEENRRSVTRLCKTIASGGLLVLPEMFSTGFLTEAKDLDSLGRELLQQDHDFLSHLAKEKGIWILGSSIAFGTAFQNRSLCFNPQGECVSQYDKIHPFSLGKESETFVGGNSIVTQRIEEFILQPIICYDLRFPELFRKGIELGINLFVVQANWPSMRQMHWETLLRARAIENQAFVIGVNCIGKQGSMDYVGGSCVISPKGEILVDVKSQEGLFSLEINFKAVQTWRRQFPALADRKNSDFYSKLSSAIKDKP